MCKGVWRPAGWEKHAKVRLDPWQEHFGSVLLCFRHKRIYSSAMPFGQSYPKRTCSSTMPFGQSDPQGVCSLSSFLQTSAGKTHLVSTQFRTNFELNLANTFACACLHTKNAENPCSRTNIHNNCVLQQFFISKNGIPERLVKFPRIYIFSFWSFKYHNWGSSFMNMHLVGSSAILVSVGKSGAFIPVCICPRGVWNHLFVDVNVSVTVEVVVLICLDSRTVSTAKRKKNEWVLILGRNWTLAWVFRGNQSDFKVWALPCQYIALLKRVDICQSTDFIWAVANAFVKKGIWQPWDFLIQAPWPNWIRVWCGIWLTFHIASRHFYRLPLLRFRLPCVQFRCTLSLRSRHLVSKESRRVPPAQPTNDEPACPFCRSFSERTKCWSKIWFLGIVFAVIRSTDLGKNFSPLWTAPTMTTQSSVLCRKMCMDNGRLVRNKNIVNMWHKFQTLRAGGKDDAKTSDGEKLCGRILNSRCLRGLRMVTKENHTHSKSLSRGFNESYKVHFWKKMNPVASSLANFMTPCSIYGTHTSMSEHKLIYYFPSHVSRKTVFTLKFNHVHTAQFRKTGWTLLMVLSEGRLRFDQSESVVRRKCTQPKRITSFKC